MKDVEEPAERRVTGVLQPLVRILGEMHRQRTIRPEQTEQPHLQPRRPVALRLEGRERRRRERQIRVLAQAHRFVDRPQRASPAWLVVVQTLEPPQRLVEVVPVRRRRELREERQSVGLAPC